MVTQPARMPPTNPAMARVLPVVMTVGIGKSSAGLEPNTAIQSTNTTCFSLRRRDEHPLATQDTCRNPGPLLRPVQEPPERSRPQKGVRRRQGGPPQELVQRPRLVTICGLRNRVSNTITLLGVIFFFPWGVGKDISFVGEGIMHQSAAMRPPCVNNGERVVEGPRIDTSRI